MVWEDGGPLDWPESRYESSDYERFLEKERESLLKLHRHRCPSCGSAGLSVDDNGNDIWIVCEACEHLDPWEGWRGENLGWSCYEAYDNSADDDYDTEMDRRYEAAKDKQDAERYDT